jgi:hypothetical protein
MHFPHMGDAFGCNRGDAAKLKNPAREQFHACQTLPRKRAGAGAPASQGRKRPRRATERESLRLLSRCVLRAGVNRAKLFRGARWCRCSEKVIRGDCPVCCSANLCGDPQRRSLAPCLNLAEKPLSHANGNGEPLKGDIRSFAICAERVFHALMVAQYATNVNQKVS